MLGPNCNFLDFYSTPCGIKTWLWYQRADEVCSILPLNYISLKGPIISSRCQRSYCSGHLVHKRPFELINALKRLYTGPVIASVSMPLSRFMRSKDIFFFSLGSCSLSSVMSEVFSGAPFLSFNIGRTSWAPSSSDVTLGTKFWWGSWDPPPPK